QLLHGDDVGNDHVADDLGRIDAAAAAALFLLALAGPAHRGQRPHPFGGVLVAPGQGLDGQPALPAGGFALGARDGLAVGAGVLGGAGAFGPLGVGRLAVGAAHARGARRTRRLGPRRRLGRAEAARTRARRTRVEGGVADGLAGRTGPVAGRAGGVAF